MDYLKLIQLIHSRPELWDRCNTYFRETKCKENAWEEIAVKMGETASSCKDGFKHLREKYIREREKIKLYKDKYKPWELFSYLSFLDQQIIPRKKFEYIEINDCDNIDEMYLSANESTENNSNHFPATASFPESFPKKSVVIDSRFQSNQSHYSSVEDILEAEKFKISSRVKFDKLLVQLVKQSPQLWDWKNPDFSNKQARTESWDAIANQLNKTSSECGLRWKGLREKYIREKVKNRDEKYRWELLEEMSFLDGVIQYRGTKNSHEKESGSLLSGIERKFFVENNKDDSAAGDFLFGGESSSNGDYHYKVFAEDNSIYKQGSCTEIKQEIIEDIPDSSYDSEGSTRKRRRSINSSCSTQIKKQKDEKSPEELFGELVASLLLRKNESERHLAMVEIMKVLAK